MLQEWILSHNKAGIILPVEVEVHGKQFYFRAEYHTALVTELRALENSKWDPELKQWHAPVNERNVYALEQLQGHYDKHYRPRINPISWTTDAPLREYQYRAIQFMLDYRRVEIAADMGVGKTLIALEVIRIIGGIWLVVAPKSALVQWKRECIKWQRFPQIIFSTYESLHKHPKTTQIIFDETIKVMTPTANRSRVAREYADYARNQDGYIFNLSGAPAPRDPRCWWNQIEILQPGHIREGSPAKLGYRLGEWDFDGEFPTLKEWNEDEVKAFARRISPICLVIKKKDAIPELPDKIFERIYIKPTEEWTLAAQTIADNAPNAIVALTLLREFSDGFIKQDGILHEQENSPKEQKLHEFLEFYLDGNPPRIVVYGAFLQTIKKISRVAESLGWKVGYSYGEHPASLDFLDRFDSLDTQPLCLVANPACTHGMALQRSPCLIYYSNTFNGDHRIQSLERADRIGKDMSYGTRVIDLIHLPTDEQVLDTVERNLAVQTLTLEEIRKCLNTSTL